VKTLRESRSSQQLSSFAPGTTVEAPTASSGRAPDRMPPSLLVSVVVPTYRRPELLNRCLAALAKQDIDPEGYEIIVADDGEDAGTRELVLAWARRTGGRPVLRYVPVGRTRGPAGARNCGWRIASSPVIAFTDDDTQPRPDWLREGLAAMAGGATAASGRIVVPLPSRQAPTDYELDASHLGSVEFATANCFVRRAALCAIGGFDQRFTAAWREDSDLQFSLLRARATVVFAPRAIVVHPVRPAPWGVSARQQSKVVFDALLYKKHRDFYRQRIRPVPPWNYYCIVTALVLAISGMLYELLPLAVMAWTVWAGLTAEFCLRRLRNTARTLSHVLEMIVTSVLIPPLSVFWRITGAWRFKVFFL
jgi:glycosyltransferase involved in cell wall biosynthesis